MGLKGISDSTFVPVVVEYFLGKASDILDHLISSSESIEAECFATKSIAGPDSVPNDLPKTVIVF